MASWEAHHMSAYQTEPPDLPERLTATKAAIGELVSGIVEARITFVDNLGREIFTTRLDVRPGQVITQKVPTPDDIELTP